MKTPSYYSVPFSMAMLVCCAVFVSAQPVNYTLSDAAGKKQIRFESHAPVEYIEGVANGIQGTVTLDTSRSDLGLQASVGVPVDQMRTGNDMRDEHLRSDQWLSAVRYPGIRFELAPVSASAVTKKSDGVWFVKAEGFFTLKGVTKTVAVPISIKQTGNKIHVDGRFSVHLEDYGVNGPIGIKMIGMKVSPDVQVILNLVGVEDPGWGTVPKKK